MRLIIDLLAGALVALSLLVPKAHAQAPVVTGYLTTPAAPGQVGSFIQFGSAGGQATNITGWAGTVLGAPSNYGTSPGAVKVPGVNAFITSGADPCFASAKTNLPINTNSTSSVQLIALSGSTTIYICSLSLISAGATTVALTTGTGTACVTNNAAVIGSTTANIANSISLVASGGFTLGSGVGTVAEGASASEFCIILGSSVYVAGNLTYVQQ